MTHTNTEGLSDADPIDAKAFADFKAWWKETSQHKAPELKHIARKAALAGWIAALSRRSASNTGARVEVKAVENALAMLSELQQERSDGAVYEDAVREKAGFCANVIRSLLAAVNSAQSKAASLNGLVSLALRELDALGAETVPVQIRNGLSALSSLAAEAEPVAWGIEIAAVPDGYRWMTGGKGPFFGRNYPVGGDEITPLFAHPSSSVSAEVTVTDEMGRALRLLQERDSRDDRVQEIIEDLREIVLLMPAATRPEGLMKKAQDAVYAMRGRLRLMDDAAITGPLAAITAPPDEADEVSEADVGSAVELYDRLVRGGLSKPTALRKALLSIRCAALTHPQPAVSAEVTEGAWNEFTEAHRRHFPYPDGTEIEVTGRDTQYRSDFSKVMRVRSPQWNGHAPYISFWRLPRTSINGGRENG